MKARIVGPFGEGLPSVVFYCPGCRQNHAVPYVKQNPPPAGPQWYFNEDVERPTIVPSLRILNLDGNGSACHVIVTNGVLNYCGDCAHPMRGTAVPMVDCKLISEE